MYIYSYTYIYIYINTCPCILLLYIYMTIYMYINIYIFSIYIQFLMSCSYTHIYIYIINIFTRSLISTISSSYFVHVFIHVIPPWHSSGRIAGPPQDLGSTFLGLHEFPISSFIQSYTAVNRIIIPPSLFRKPLKGKHIIGRVRLNTELVSAVIVLITLYSEAESLPSDLCSRNTNSNLIVIVEM